MKLALAKKNQMGLAMFAYLLTVGAGYLMRMGFRLPLVKLLAAMNVRNTANRWWISGCRARRLPLSLGTNSFVKRYDYRSLKALKTILVEAEATRAGLSLDGPVFRMNQLLKQQLRNKTVGQLGASGSSENRCVWRS